MRCRAVSATVLIRMLVGRCSFSFWGSSIHCEACRRKKPEQEYDADVVRCSFSLFPFGVSDLSPKRCPKSETGVPKSVQKSTKWSPKRSTWPQNGTKMTTVGPKCPIRGSNTIFGGPGPRKRVQNGGQNGPKIDQNHNMAPKRHPKGTKNRSKNRSKFGPLF